jgi:hypothetical protein
LDSIGFSRAICEKNGRTTSELEREGVRGEDLTSADSHRPPSQELSIVARGEKTSLGSIHLEELLDSINFLLAISFYI